jgi:hypothetical protein
VEVEVIDKMVFADKVGALLKGKYANLPKQERAAAFSYAFNEVADTMHIRGDARCTLKGEVGKILSKRPRKKRIKTTGNKQPLPSFEVIESDNRSYVIFQTKESSPSRFRFIPAGWTMRPNNTGEVLMNTARVFAKTFFAECAKTVRKTPVRIVQREASTVHLSLILDGLFEVYFVEGKRGVNASVTKLRTPCKQKDVPHELLREARGIATAYFKSIGTVPLRFE